jgi:tetratricopeptide (TPR) repeat protein
MDQERPEEARRWALRVVDRAKALEDHESLVGALIVLDYADAQAGVAGVGERHREALRISIEHGLRQQESLVRRNLGFLAYYAGQWTEAAEWYVSSREQALEAGSAFKAAETDVNLAELLVNQGRTAEAEEILTGAVRVLRASGAAQYLAEGHLQLARVHLSHGSLDEAVQRARESATRFEELGNHSSVLEAALVQGEALVRAGHPAEALEVIAAAERVAHADAAFSLPRTCLQRGRALLALARADEAAEMVSTGLVAAREQGLPYEEALLLRLGADIARDRGDEDAASADAARATLVLAGLGVREQQHPEPGVDHPLPMRASP